MCFLATANAGQPYDNAEFRSASIPSAQSQPATRFRKSECSTAVVKMDQNSLRMRYDMR
jgi:hypothetical protein